MQKRLFFPKAIVFKNNRMKTVSNRLKTIVIYFLKVQNEWFVFKNDCFIPKTKRSVLKRSFNDRFQKRLTTQWLWASSLCTIENKDTKVCRFINTFGGIKNFTKKSKIFGDKFWKFWAIINLHGVLWGPAQTLDQSVQLFLDTNGF